MYTPVKLAFADSDAAIMEVELPEDNDAGPPSPKRPARKFRMTIKFVRTVSIGALEDFIKGRVPPNQEDGPLDAITALQIIVRHFPSMLQNVVSAGRGFYWRGFATDPKELNIRGGAEAWSGIKMSVKPGTRCMLLNADLGTTTFMKSGAHGLLLDIVADILNRRDRNELRTPLREDDCRKLERALKNFRVEVRARPDQKRRHRISKVTTTPANRTYFEWDNGGQPERIDVARYYDIQYGLRLAFSHLPCLVVGAKNTYIPVEICHMLPNQRIIRKLNEIQTAEMIRVSQKKPQDRLNRITDGLNEMIGPSDRHGESRINDHLGAFGIELATKPMDVDARVLDPPVLFFSPNSEQPEHRPSNGAWNLRSRQVAATVVLENWSVVSLAARENRRVIEDFIKVLVRTGENSGLKIVNGFPIIRPETPDLDAKNVHGILQKACYDAMGPGRSHKPQLILIVLPDTGKRLYGEIKRVAETVIGVTTQCVQISHVKAKKVPYCANLCLKINAKLGGINTYLGKLGNGPQLPFINEVPTIVFGADITHPPAFDDTKPSIASIVASMDETCCKYRAAVRVQRPRPGEPARQDIIQDVAGMVTELLQAFKDTTGHAPKRILFYRDGVSDGQFANVRDVEVAEILLACYRLHKNYSPKITYVAVQKRHSARFFPIHREDADRSGNVQAGTVVDRGVVHPVHFDFYLNSHAGLQGTSRPSHYYVLEDQNGFTSDSLQELTYRLCYIYARATRSVSVVPPVYYADLMCQRARLFFEGWDDSESSLSGGSDASAFDKSFRNVHKELEGRGFEYT
ncbi:argonaute 1 [Borealophlyctis nickersoniae]|nr:argonaute 1 [Borealophlyctis nickersoniae]